MTKLLTKTKFLVVCAVITLILFIAGNLPYSFMEDYSFYRFDVLVTLVDCVCLIALLIAFKKGETNVQKTLLGALIYGSMIGTFQNFIDYVDILSNGYADFVYDTVLFAAFSIGEIGLFVSHVILQSDHKGSKKAIYAIYVFVAIGIIANIVDAIHEINLGLTDGSLYLLNNFGCDFFFLTILCIEARVQAYKEIREKATANGTWTPEAKAEAKKLFKI